MKRSLISLIIILFLAQSNAQSKKIYLLDRTKLDNQGFHITTFKSKPEESLSLPNIDLRSSLFFSLDNLLDPEDYKISVLLDQSIDEDFLYIDKNNDENLNNDDKPTKFPISQNSIEIKISSPIDTNRSIIYRLSRKPIATDPSFQTVLDTMTFDENGNLKSKITFMFSMNNPKFTGAPRTYYFDERMSLRQGDLLIDNKSYKVGIFDWTNNGLYNDGDNHFGDLFLIDFNDDERLNIDDFGEVFYLNEIFEIRNKRYEIVNVEPYGRYIEIKETSKAISSIYASQHQSTLNENFPKTKLRIDKKFWTLTFVTIENKELSLADYRDKFILLNFWGEWCKPCIDEIPELIEIWEKFSNNLEIFSFLKTSDLEKAKKMINDKRIRWPNVVATDSLLNLMKIKGYPTNILISPEREVLINTFKINKDFVSKYIKPQ